MLKQLAGQTAIYGVGTIVPRFLNYLLFPYLTRLMTTGEYGVVTDLYALIPFALVVLTMGLETGYFRFAGQAATERERKEVFETTWGAVSLFALLFFAAALLFTPALARIMDYAEHPSYIRLTAAIIALDAATAIPFARLRQQGRAKRFVALRLLSVAVNLALTVFFYSVLPALASRGADAGMYDPAFEAGYVLVANLLGSAVVWVGLYPSCHGARPRIRPKLLRAVMLYSLPLLISGIAGTANEFIDRQMIKYLLPPESSMDALGIYGAVAKLGVVLMLFTQMYRYAAEPYFLSAFRQEDFRRSNAEALKYFIIVSVGIFLTIMLFVDLFGLLMGRDFRQGIRVLPIILLANMFSGIWLNLSFWYKQSGPDAICDLDHRHGTRVHGRTESGADPGARLSGRRSGPSRLRDGHGRRQLLSEPEALPDALRPASDRIVLSGGRRDLRPVAADGPSEPCGALRRQPAVARSLRVACRTPRADRPKRVASLDRQALDCETALSEKRNAILVTNINRTVR